MLVTNAKSSEVLNPTPTPKAAILISLTGKLMHLFCTAKNRENL